MAVCPETTPKKKPRVSVSHLIPREAKNRKKKKERVGAYLTRWIYFFQKKNK